MINRLATLFVRAAFLFLLLLTVSIAVFAQDEPLKINYRLGMTHPSSHLFEVKVEVERPADAMVDSLDFQMAKWSPGRYAVFDFAKNVQQFEALGGICPRGAQCKMPTFPVNRVDDQTWRVATMNTHRLTIRYKVFGNDLSGTFSQLDSRHANYNGGSIFMYVVNHKPDPVKLEISPPAGWNIVNGRMTSLDQREWQFPNWDILTDTPTEIAPDSTLDEFQVDGKLYRVMVHSFGDEGGKRAALVRDIEKIVRAETAMWGPPEFDSYTFLIHFAADDHSGDGMEHLTSTQIIEPGVLGETRMYDEVYLKSPNATYYLRGRGYTNEDFQRVASETGGFDLTDFFQRYVRGVGVLPYDEALSYVGMHLVREQAREPFNAGIGVDWEKPGTLTIGSVRNDSPAEDAGLQEGDEIVSLGRKSVSRENWLVALARYKQGDRVPVAVKRDRRTIQTAIVLGAPERFEYKIEERKDATPKQKALRQAWLKG